MLCAWQSNRRHVNRCVSFTGDRFTPGLSPCKRAVEVPLTGDAFNFHGIDKGLELQIQIPTIHAARVSRKPNFFSPTETATCKTSTNAMLLPRVWKERRNNRRFAYRYSGNNNIEQSGPCFSFSFFILFCLVEINSLVIAKWTKRIFSIREI